uniref:Uncharacterized protein n=1 Tax=Arundo donax TaxID=35708 RepID=A0A0A9HBS1_ARUDO
MLASNRILALVALKTRFHYLLLYPAYQLA